MKTKTSSYSFDMNNLSDKLSPSSNSARRVRLAEINDIPGIISVLEQNLISYKKALTTDILEQTGFLINGFTYEDAKAAILDKDNFIFLISTENDNVIGYATGCNVKKLKSIYQEELAAVSSEVRNIVFSEKAFYLRHIAKKIDTKHVGKELLQTLLDQAIYAGYEYIICVIAEKPIQNKASKIFHEKVGFRCAGYNQDGDRIFAVYFKKI